MLSAMAMVIMQRRSSTRHLTAYRVRSALIVASLLDGGMTDIATIDGHQVYHYLTSQGRFPPDQLREGEALLQDLGFLVERDGTLIATGELRELARMRAESGAEALLLKCAPLASESNLAEVASDLITDPRRREAILLALGRCYHAEAQKELGAVGEEVVVSAARSQLLGIGRADLAEQVCRVSVVSDDLGYDVVAPRLDGTVRMMEVKTCGSPAGATVECYLSRNEADVGLRFSDWSLVICNRETNGVVEITGWCVGRSLQPYLPSDGARSEWIRAYLSIPMSLLIKGLPEAV